MSKDCIRATASVLYSLCAFVVLAFSIPSQVSAESPAESSDRQLIEKLIEGLKKADSPDTDGYSAIYWLSDIGEPAVPSLLQALKDPNPCVRMNVARALLEIGPEAKEAVPALIEMLDDTAECGEGVRVNEEVVKALGQIGIDNYLVPEVNEALKQNPELCSTAISYLRSEMEPCLSTLTETLEDRSASSEDREDAAVMLAKLGPSGRAALLEILKNEDPEFRAKCLFSITWSSRSLCGARSPETEGILEAIHYFTYPSNFETQIPPWVDPQLVGLPKRDPEEVTRELIDSLDHEDAWFRKRVVEALAEAEGDPHAIFSALVRVLADEDHSVREAGVRALAKIDYDVAEVVQKLLQALDDPDHRVRQAAVFSLTDVNADPREIVPALVRALDDSNILVRANAAKALAEVKGDANAIFDALIAALRDLDINVRIGAVQALPKVGTDPARIVEALMEALDDKVPLVRAAGAEELGKIGPGAEKAVPALLWALEDKSISVRRSAIDALVEIDPNSEKTILALIKALQDEFWGVRYQAVTGLGKTKGAMEKEIVLALFDKIDDDEEFVRRIIVETIVKISPGPQANDSWVRSEAAYYLGEIGPEARETVPVLIWALSDESASVRANAASALGKIGPDASAAIPYLVKALDDEDFDVRLFADIALSQIGFDTKKVVTKSELK
jgi:HEAT repeat protein